MSELFYKDPAAPPLTRLKLGVAFALTRRGRLLLDHRKDGGWALFGGAMELGETIEECARREIMEELGISVGTLDLVGVFSDPSRIIRCTDGTVVQPVTVTFSTEWETGDFILSCESRDAKWFTPDRIDPSMIAPTHRMILPHLFDQRAWPVIM